MHFCVCCGVSYFRMLADPALLDRVSVRARSRSASTFNLVLICQDLKGRNKKHFVLAILMDTDTWITLSSCLFSYFLSMLYSLNEAHCLVVNHNWVASIQRLSSIGWTSHSANLNELSEQLQAQAHQCKLARLLLWLQQLICETKLCHAEPYCCLPSQPWCSLFLGRVGVNSGTGGISWWIPGAGLLCRSCSFSCEAL